MLYQARRLSYVSVSNEAVRRNKMNFWKGFTAVFNSEGLGSCCAIGLIMIVAISVYAMIVHRAVHGKWWKP